MKDSIGQIIETTNTSYFSYSEFSNNYFESKTGKIGLEVKASESIYFEECTFRDNLGNSTTPNLYIIDSISIYFYNSTFKNTRKYTYQTNNVFGGFMYLIANTSVTIYNSTFKYGIANSGGSIYLIGDSTLAVDKSSFTDGYAT